ncbi:hypothetical protein V8D89_002099 [Ganoderma adspersum]
MSTPANEATRDLENGTDTPVRQQRSSVPSLLFLSFVLFMLMNGKGDDFASTRDLYVNGLQSLNWQLGNFSAWLNGTETNFTLPVQDPNTMPLVSAFLPFGVELDPRRASYYSNMTGFWHGDLHLHNLTALNATEEVAPWRHLSEQWMLASNLTAIQERLGPWNWTRSDKVTLNVGDKRVPFKGKGGNETKNVAIIHGKVDLADPESQDDLRLDFEGIHILSTGTVYALAESTGHGIDLRNLPALVPEAYRNDSARAVEAEVGFRISRLKDKIDAGAFEQDTSSTDESPKTKCSFKLFAQLNASSVPKEFMEELEREFDEPTGITTVKAPELALQGVLLSQNCGILYEIKQAVGVQTQRLYGKITTYAGLSTVVNFLLLALFRRQAAQSSSAAGLSRVSRYTFLIQSLLDAISFVGHVTVAILAEGRPSLSVLAPAGLACLLFIYEAQFAVLIGQIQAPEDTAPRPAAPAPAPPLRPQPQTEGSAAPTTATEGQTALAGAPRPAAPPPPPALPQRPSFFRFLWQHIRTDPAARLWTLMSLCLIVVFRIVIMLSLPLFFIGSLYTSVWLMQIYRSARRARSSGLSAEYLVGSTLGRLFFLLYFLGCPKNIFDVQPRGWIWIVAGFMLLQAFVILLQEQMDPCFFLPSRMSRAQPYNYHPAIPLPDPEAPEQTLGDCAICMEAILVDPSLRRRSKSSDAKERPAMALQVPFLKKVGTAKSKKTYSLAPCHHLFHTECLERWLTYKNICPQCRRPLPPI